MADPRICDGEGACLVFKSLGQAARSGEDECGGQHIAAQMREHRVLTPTEGEAIVFKPDGKGGYQLVGQLTATQWGDLVRDLVVRGLAPQQLSDERPVPHDRPHAHQLR